METTAILNELKIQATYLETQTCVCESRVDEYRILPNSVLEPDLLTSLFERIA